MIGATVTVFIVQKDERKDFSAAERFGKTEIVFSRGLFPDDAEARIREMLEIARAVLRRFNPDTDYILLSGDPVGINIVGAVLSEDFDNYRLLKWDNQGKAYYPVTVQL